MHKNSVKFGQWFLRYASGQTNRDILFRVLCITILSPGSKVNIGQFIEDIFVGYMYKL